MAAEGEGRQTRTRERESGSEKSAGDVNVCMYARICSYSTSRPQTSSIGWTRLGQFASWFIEHTTNVAHLYDAHTIVVRTDCGQPRGCWSRKSMWGCAPGHWGRDAMTRGIE